MTWLLGRGVERPLDELLMNITALAASPGGDPFASELRALTFTMEVV